MTSSILIGINKTTEEEVIQVPAVPFTNTFHPVHHHQVIEAMKSGVRAIGLEIVKTEYVLARNGLKMFGVWDLATDNQEMCWSLGIRNSMDKSMALGITAGTRVFVCENLAFDGEFVEFRRHTRGLNYDDLEFLAYRAMKKMVNKLTRFQSWHEGLKKYPLEVKDAQVLLVEMMTNLVFPITRFPRFCELYFGGTYDPNLWGIHEATTDILRGTSLLALPQKNRALNRIINQFIEDRHIDPPSNLGHFFEQRALYHVTN